MDQLVSLLNLLGITPDKYPFLVLGILIISGVAYIRLSIGKKLGRIKDNVLIIIAHLSNSAATRGWLDTNLIQVMSPMVITPEGHQLLDKEWF